MKSGLKKDEGKKRGQSLEKRRRVRQRSQGTVLVP